MEDTFKILVVTDNHLGYSWKDPVKGNDSFIVFEEILRTAVIEDVDMIIHSGDLFHDNKPSRETLYKTAELLRLYCFGERKSTVEILNDTKNTFHDRFGVANYLDPNYNVSIPFFAIHGNHDDPAGLDGLSALELLSVSGLLNYFGKQKNIDDIVMSPILFKKGETFLSLYGLGNIKDETLYERFLQKKVKVIRPEEEIDWFNVLLIHQNRERPHTTNIPEHFLDDFLDLVIWGHEHECKLEPEKSQERGFYVSQPGSSINTSLNQTECEEKAIGLLTIQGTSFKMKKLTLYSPRPVSIKDVSFSIFPEYIRKNPKKIEEKISLIIEEAIEECDIEWKERYEKVQQKKDIRIISLLQKEPPKPQIRLRISYENEIPLFSRYRISQMFVGKVANPKELIRVLNSNKKSLKKQEIKSENKNFQETESSNLKSLFKECLQKKKLVLFPENEFSERLYMFVEKDEKDTFDVFLKNFVEKTVSSLLEKKIQPLEKEIEHAINVEKKLCEEQWRKTPSCTNKKEFNSFY